ncbi:hypothetical protein PENNAL_c0766G03017, partial [Penicillium nalgiovense]
MRIGIRSRTAVQRSHYEYTLSSKHLSLYGQLGDVAYP